MVASSSQAVFVQFPHPKDEHNPGGAKRQPWNRCDHARKFIRSDGRCVDRNGSIHDGSLVFWGEWEAPSYVIKCWPGDGCLPRFLHDPVWEDPADSDPRQNTDPWVFGDCFRYSNCKQLSQEKLRTLPRGSVILFGSTPGGNFVLDTVFVVRDAHRLVPKQPPEIDEAFRVCTIVPLSLDGECSGEEFVLYRGATREDPVEGMYSFAPCRRADSEEPRFCRPPITLPHDYLDPARTRSPSGAKRSRPIDQIRKQWESVRDQVFEARCFPGVWFRTPRLDNGCPPTN
jgi:hypothetical protein